MIEIVKISAILSAIVNGDKILGMAKGVPAKIKAKLQKYILTDTLDTIEAMQENPKLLEEAPNERKTVLEDFEKVFKEKPALKKEIQNLISDEAKQNKEFYQLIYGEGKIVNTQGGDYVEGDKIDGDKVLGDKFTGNKVVHQAPKEPKK